MINNDRKITRIDDHIPTSKELEDSLKDIPQEEYKRYCAEAQAFLDRHGIKINASR